MGSHRVGHDWSDLAAAAYLHGASLEAHGKEYACNAGDPVQSLGWEDPLEEEMAILAWESHGQKSTAGYSP